MDSVIGKPTEIEETIKPSQLSIAIGAVNSVIPHTEAKSGSKAKSGIGDVVSVIITSWVCVTVFPVESV